MQFCSVQLELQFIIVVKRCFGILVRDFCMVGIIMVTIAITIIIITIIIMTILSIKNRKRKNLNTSMPRCSLFC